MRPFAVRSGPSVLQRQLRYVYTTRREVFAASVWHVFRARQPTLRIQHVQRRGDLLQSRVWHLRTHAGRVRREPELHEPHRVPAAKRRLRHGHVQRGLRVLQPKLRHLRALWGAVFAGALLSRLHKPEQ